MKGMLQMLRVQNIKSSHSIGVRSIPKVQRSSHLELYALGREKERLEKEILAIDKRRNAARRQLDSIHKRIQKLRKEMEDKQKTKTCGDTPTTPFKTMVMNY